MFSSWRIGIVTPNTHTHDPFCGHFSAASCRWWHATIKRHDHKHAPADFGHFDQLGTMIAGSRLADDAEALAYCYHRVLREGARTASGLWCVCLAEDAPSMCDARASVGGDVKAALISIQADLEHAADELPLTWTTTHSVFEAQGRALTLDARLALYWRNQGGREIDRWLEPPRPEGGQLHSRGLTYWLMARALGGVRDTCVWPRRVTMTSVVQSLLQPKVLPAA